MTDSNTFSASKQATKSSDRQPVTNGRYLYCLVDTTGASPGDLSTSGVDDAPVYVIESDSVGAVVHHCSSVYDTEDLEQAKQWLLSHQEVVDAASNVFGTPLPMRFDTILEGGDASVKQWLGEHFDRIRTELTTFADTWEYRIHLFWEPGAFEAQIEDQDEQLQKIKQRQEQAGAGKRFLLEKQYTKRLRELKQERRTALAEMLEQRVAPVANELTEQAADTSPLTDEEVTDRERVTRLAVLSDESDETALGNLLDDIVEAEGVEIRFTGPWPPYTFAPDIG